MTSFVSAYHMDRGPGRRGAGHGLHRDRTAAEEGGKRSRIHVLRRVHQRRRLFRHGTFCKSLGYFFHFLCVQHTFPRLVLSLRATPRLRRHLCQFRILL